MERLKIRITETSQALKSLFKALMIKKPSELERDGAIQRFEFTFESLWKTAQFYLKEFESVEANSPKSCIRSLGENGILTEKETINALAMADDRNLTSHTYIETIAVRIYKRLHPHAFLMNEILSRIRGKIGLKS